MLNKQSLMKTQSRQNYQQLSASGSLKKMNRVMNPFHENNKQINNPVSNFAMFNDRNKMRLTQEVSSDPQNDECETDVKYIQKKFPIPHTSEFNQDIKSEKEVEQIKTEIINPSKKQNSHDGAEIHQQFDFSEVQQENFQLIQTTHHQMKQNMLKINKLSLSLATQRIAQSKASEKSFIGKISPFTNSQAVQLQQQKPRRRRKIFETGSRNKNSGNNDKLKSPINYQAASPGKTTRNTTPGKSEMNLNDRNQFSRITDIQGHHHACCISKSLQIIDKLSNERLHAENRDIKISKVNRFHKIYLEIAEIAMQLEELALSLCLKNLADKVPQTEELKLKLEELFKKMKQQDDFSHCLQISKEDSQYVICSLKSLYKKTSLLLLIQNNMKKWKAKLNLDILDGINLSDPSQYKRIVEYFVNAVENLQEELVFLDEDSEEGTLKQVIKMYKKYIKKEATDIRQLLYKLDNFRIKRE